MQICEIDDRDRLWANLAGINLNANNIFHCVKNVINDISASSSQRLYAKYMLDYGEKELHVLLNLADDESTHRFKADISEMLADILKNRAKLGL